MGSFFRLIGVRKLEQRGMGRISPGNWVENVTKAKGKKETKVCQVRREEK